MEKTVLNEVSITEVTVKKEEDIKEFAETAMNELLGWYGYETSRTDVKVAANCRSYSGSNDSEGELVKYNEGCGWCGKAVDDSNALISAASVFCSELCFSQSRRANFKRNKICDWCRHVRRTVSYVDFQDGASQLQFCSDKCLNQYKMHIFCRETRAHLELHPHMHGEKPSGTNLITPDLWLRNCRSPGTLSPPSKLPSPKPNEVTISEPLPQLSVTSNTKLLNPEIKKTRLRNQKKLRKRCPSTVTFPEPSSSFSDAPQDLRMRHTPPLDETDNSTDLKQSQAIVNDNENKSEPTDGAKVSPSCLNAILGNLLPPPTVFVPYPVILPLPIPIPIPIPIPKTFKSNNNKDLIELKETSTQTESQDIVEEEKVEEILSVKEEAVVRRPLRKRKRVVEPRPKHKKTFSNSL